MTFSSYDLVRINSLPALERCNTYIWNDVLNCPHLIVDFFNAAEKLNDKPEEYVYILALDNKMMPLGIFELGHGSYEGVISDMKSLYVRLLLIGASGYVLVHNHPSGDPTPSITDRKLSKVLEKTSKLMDIKMHDSIIIGRDSFYSFKESEV